MKSLFIVGVFIDFFIIWYLGLLFREYRRSYKNVYVFILYFCAALWILIALHMGMAMNVSDIFIRDINGDNKIGIEEIIYILQIISGIKQL